MKGVMIQGTASDVGKSLIVTALCRLLANEGYAVAPFKSQNMSNNSYVTMEGKEIGRAQGAQAEAARTEASVWMNPILLKPRSDQHAEVIQFGTSYRTLSGKDYRESYYEMGIESIERALDHLQQNYDVVVMEGAGSPVEVNLKDRELVNMKVAEMADVPVILVADIDRGGVFASIVGTLELLDAHERKRVKGIIINKFRGDPALFEDGITWLEERTGLPMIGVLPYVEHHVEGEDSLSLTDRFTQKKGALEIVVLQLPFVSNYSDMEPFNDEDVTVRWVQHSDEVGDPDAVIIPGTKSTIRDLDWLKDRGFDDVLQSYIARGGSVVGICGGYQMLTETLMDPYGADTGEPGKTVEGMGLIPAQTSFHIEKTTVRASGSLHSATNLAMPIEGYEIHLGETRFAHTAKPFLQIEGRPEGYYGEGGRVIGTYLHHLFHNDEWRTEWLNRLRTRKGLPQQKQLNRASMKEKTYDHLANQLKPHLNWELMKSIMFQRVRQ
ncbi:cobyric acid synthase [Alkalihalobacillus hwajinpoensis]|uniref:cobyric acid synthase n=1 Tax=Guptibacillus hwajinpoensis TaxID=208199 RepID=UPI0018838047|nr:cobyric acid synthase [Pseudalkalibacillus hwajinpoensis]MBF0705338.1 cobyric acid synthase [Pseudalkalibacillus hwajinpoensis]